MAKENWDVILVGGGPSGLGIGAMLAVEGKKVLVLEKNDYLGGRACATKFRGHYLDNGLHAAICTGDVERVFQRIGKPFPEIHTFWNKTEVLFNGEWKDLGAMVPSDKMKKLIGEILSKSYMEIQYDYDDVPLEDWIRDNIFDEGLKHFLWYFGGAVCAEGKLDGLSAGDVMDAIKRLVEYRGNFVGHAGSFSGGMNSMLDPMADAIRENGGEIRTGTRVTNIVVEDGKARGVEVEVGEKGFPSHFLDAERIEASVVVNTLPIWDFFNVLNEDLFPPWYVEWIKGISTKFANVWTSIYSLDEPIFEESTFRWVPELPRTKIGCWPIPSPGSGREVGEYQLHCLIQCSWDQVPLVFKSHEAKTRKAMEQWFDLFEEDLEEVLPGLKAHTIWKIRQAAVYNITEAPGFVGGHRPHIKIPGVRNLYLSSDTVRDARSGCIPAASVAMTKCADMILGKE